VPSGPETAFEETGSAAAARYRGTSPKAASWELAGSMGIPFRRPNETPDVLPAAVLHPSIVGP
jgi:hypothetical protein